MSSSHHGHHQHQHPFEGALGLGVSVPLPPGTLTSRSRSRRSHHHSNGNSGEDGDNGMGTAGMPNSFTEATLVPLSRTNNGNNTAHVPAPTSSSARAPARSMSPPPPPSPSGGGDPRGAGGGGGDHRYHVNEYEDYHEDEYSGDEMDRYYARKYEEEQDDEIVPFARPVESDLDSDGGSSAASATEAECEGEEGGDGIVDGSGDRHEDNDGDEDDASDAEESSVVSLTPPPSLPLLVVNLNKLCGYDPSGVEEADTLRRRIEEELLGSTRTPPGEEADSETPPPPPPPPHERSSGSASPSSVVDTPSTTGDLVSPTAVAASAGTATETGESSHAEGRLEGGVPVAPEAEADAGAVAPEVEADAGGDGGEAGGDEGEVGEAENDARTEGSDADGDAEAETAEVPSHAPPPVTDVVTVGDGVSLDFASRSEQLFDAGVASHADTSRLAMPTPVRPSPSDTDGDTDDRGGGCERYHSRLLVVEGGTSGRKVYYCVLPYPEYLGVSTSLSSSSSSGGQQQQTSVSRSWKLLLRPHPIPPVQTILSLLAKSSRPLPWKMEMNRCVRSLAKDEWRARQRRMQRAALQRWRKVERPERLDRLYETRDVFRDRLEDAEVRLEVLRGRRMERTSSALARRRYLGGDEEGGMGSGVAVDDLAGETFDFLLRDDERGGAPIDDDSSSSDAEEYYGSGEDEDEGDGRGRRRPRPRSNRRGRPKETTAAAAAAAPRRNDERDRKWREEKRRIVAASVTPEERAAEALVEGLRKRLARVDDLLESLQEEEWAEEEEEDGGADRALEPEPADEEVDDDAPGGRLSLLDQILAMIMGSQPDPDLERLMSAQADGGEGFEVVVLDDISTVEELERKKFLHLRACHEDTVRAWREHFGRLPRLSPGSASRVSATEARPDRCDGDGTTSGFGAAADGDSANLDKSGKRGERNTTNCLSRDEGSSEWKQVENWEDLLPDHASAGDQNGGGASEAAKALAANMNSDSLAPTSVVERKPMSFGLRPGGRLKHS